MFADHLAAQRRGVGMVAFDDLVDLSLAVARARLEEIRQPAQHNRALLAAGRDLLQARSLEEISHYFVLPGIALHLMHGYQLGQLLRREQSLAGRAQLLRVESVEMRVALRAHLYQSQLFEPRKMVRDRRCL